MSIVKWSELKVQVEAELAKQGLTDANIYTIDLAMPTRLNVRVKNGAKLQINQHEDGRSDGKSLRIDPALFPSFKKHLTSNRGG